MRRTLALTALALAVLVSLPLAAARTDDALALVPADAATVGVIRVSDLRTSPLADRVFAHIDHMSVDGEAARFLEETRLNPKEDVDTIVVAGSPGADGARGSGLVIFEGRFDPARLAAAMSARGVTSKSTGFGDYFVLDDARHNGKPGAVAFVSTHLVIGGDEASVSRALAVRSGGGSGFVSGAGLGRHLSRVESGASAWALVDLQKMPMKNRAHANGHGEDPAVQLASAMKQVSLLAVQATAKGDALKLSATGLADDEETRQLLEDAVKGVLAGWRLALQEKNPDAVSVIRRFKVSHDKDGVSISGTLPGAAIRALTEKKQAAVTH